MVRQSADLGLYPIIEYTFSLPMTADDDPSWATVEQQARTLTYHPDQQFTSDVLFRVPPDPMFGRRTYKGIWHDADSLPIDALRPKEVQRLFVLGGCADVTRACARELMRPLALIDLGTRFGKIVARETDALPVPAGVRLRGRPVVNPVATGDVRECLTGLRSGEEDGTVVQDARSLPVLGRYDVVVIGGGTAGEPAGIAAARQGAKTLVVEKLHGLGGVGTMGAISNYCQGNRVGFTASVGGGNSWIIEQKMEWWRQALLDAGAEIWFGAIGCGAFVGGPLNNEVVGALVVTPRGRGVVLADVVVDATGNADIAAAGWSVSELSESPGRPGALSSSGRSVRSWKWYFGFFGSKSLSVRPTFSSSWV